MEIAWYPNLNACKFASRIFGFLENCLIILDFMISSGRDKIEARIPSAMVLP
jgi:hypothetical protein